MYNDQNAFKIFEIWHTGWYSIFLKIHYNPIKKNYIFYFVKKKKMSIKEIEKENK
jgi:hypothetical protein